MVGVEVGGAVKNVLAIATGICDALELGLNARAALITRGLAEMTRLGCALGGRPDTFMGLTGVGDLILTATGDLSRNRQCRTRTRAAAQRRRRRWRDWVTSPRACIRPTPFAAVRVRPGWRCRSPRPCARYSTVQLSPPQALDSLLAREPKREAVQR